MGRCVFPRRGLGKAVALSVIFSIPVLVGAARGSDAAPPPPNDPTAVVAIVAAASSNITAGRSGMKDAT